MYEKQFEDFLVGELIKWASSEARAGFRYQFRTPSDDNRLKLYNAMIGKSNEEVIFLGTTLKIIKIDTLRLLPLLHLDNDNGLNEHFIATLRDYVTPGTVGPIAGCVAIIIHNSDLDTIHNSSEKLDKHNAIWSSENIKEMLGKMINPNDKGKDVSLSLLDYQFNAIQEDGATMFGFAPLYNALLDGDLRFKELFLLNDPLIESFSGKPEQIKTRLEENRKLYKELDYVVEHFPNNLENRLEFGSKFIHTHFPPDNINNWKTVDFEEFRKETINNKSQTLEFEKEIAGNNVKLVARNRSESKAGQRERNIIIIVEDDQSEFQFELHFIGNDLEETQLKKKTNGPSTIDEFKILNKSSKHTKTIYRSKFDGSPQYFGLSIDRDKSSERYKFNCLALRKDDFFVDAFKTNFVLIPGKKEIVLQTDNNKLKINETLNNSFIISGLNQEVDSNCYGEIDYSQLANESDLIEFTVNNGSNILKFSIEGNVATDTLTLPILIDKGRYIRLLDDEYFGEFNRSKDKVIIDNKEVSPVSTRLNLLRWEARFLDEDMVAFPTSGGVPLKSLKSISSELHLAYIELFKFLRDRKTLPSLVAWGSEFRSCVKNIVDEYIFYLEKILKNTVLNSSQKIAMELGVGEFDGKTYFTPYHPLILAYYLSVAEQIALDSEIRSFNTLPKITLDRLTPRGLIPYLYSSQHGFEYSQQVKENTFWLELVPQQECSYKFVRKLVKDKITEFKLAFNQLFLVNNSKLIINALNQNDSYELFLGLVDYFRAQLDSACPVHVNLYDDSLQINAFDRFAEESNHLKIKEILELNKGASKDIADTVIDLLRTRLTYSKFEHIQNSSVINHAYAHLAFFRNNQKIDCIQIEIDSALSGVSADGLLASEASENKEGSYYTAFGLKHVDYKEHSHLKLAKLYGAIYRAAKESNAQYTGKNAVSLAVSDNFKYLLEKSYDAAIWTTIIDPKVTLDFFTSNNDVVLIHYSDQYSSSASYDAITVTRETELFRRVLQKGQTGIIDEFNSFNGEWLLKMLTAKDNEKKSIEGIIGAYKFITGIVIGADITWVPLSVAEMIRVSGNIGLIVSESEFSRNLHGYRSGAISDDILLVGFKAQKIYLLPVEVKTGAKPNYDKAVKQTKELKRYLNTLLGPRTFANKLYRALFIRQILTQIDKYTLYKVFDANYFDSIIADRELWLRGEYQLADIENYPQGFVVAHVDSDTIFGPSYKEVESIVKIELPYSLLSVLVKTPFLKLLNDVNLQKHCHVPEEYVLKGKTNSIPVNIITDGQAPEDAILEYQEQISISVESTSEHTKNSEINGPSHPGPISYIDRSINPLKVLFGHKVMTNEPIFWEPTNTNKIFNTNTGIIGTMGTGKTQFTKSMITQLIRNQNDNVGGQPIGILIFDYKADYVKDDFVKATNAKVYNLYNLPFNPFAILGNKPILPVHTASQFRTTLSKAFGLGPKQENRIHLLVMEAYERAGILPEDSSTWAIQAPTLKNIWDIFNEQDKVEQDSLHAALYDLITFQIFEPQPDKTQSLYDTLNGVIVINLSGYDTKIQNLVVAITLDIFYSQMHQHGSSLLNGDYRQITKLILVDEADNFMSQEFESLKKILKEGREFGVGTILSTQELTHFKTSEADYSTYILTWIIHRVSQLKNQDIKSIFNPKNKQAEDDIMSQIRMLEKHYSIYIDGEKNIAKLKDQTFWELLINEH